MAAFTSKATGNWSSGGSTTWTTAGTPGNGDTVTIADTHTVTVDVNTTVGSSPASGGTAAIIVTGTTGKLIIAAGITLIARGDIRLNNAPFTMNAGAILEFDASAASSPSSQHYLFYWGDGGYNNNCLITITGTSGSKCTIRSNAGGGTAAITAAGCRWHGDIDHCNFTNLGSASTAALDGGVNGGKMDFEFCVFDGCGDITAGEIRAAQIARFVNVTKKNSVGTYSIYGFATTEAITSGTRLIQDCVFDLPFQSSFRDFTITGTLFSGTSPVIVLSERLWASFTGNFLNFTGATGFSIYASVSDCYLLMNTATANPHFLGVEKTLTISGCVFEYTGSDANGDCVLVGAAVAGAKTLTLSHNLGLPNGGGNCSGTLISSLGNSDATLSVTHNTWCCGAQGAVVVGETYAGHAGLLATCANNLVWDTSARGYKVNDLSSSVTDLVSSANAHHNAGYNLLAGSNLKGYNNLDFSSGSPGAGDVDGTDPNFVDSARDIAKWDTSLGGAGTAANALTELRKKNEAGYNTAYTIAALVTYVKAGFVPRASALQAASDNVSPSNGWIGAGQGSIESAVAGDAIKPRYRRFVHGG